MICRRAGLCGNCPNPIESRILEFRLEGDFEGNDKNMIEYVNSLYAFTTSMATNFIIDIYGKKDMFDYIVINTGETNIVDFNMPEDKRKNLMQIGYSQTIEYFNKHLPVKKENLLEIYQDIQDKLIKIQKHLKRMNIQKAKSLTAELFIDLCDYKEVIELKIFKNISEFQKYFYKNIDYPALFGKTTLNKAEAVSDKLDFAIKSLSLKTSELSEYLEKYKQTCSV